MVKKTLFILLALILLALPLFAACKAAPVEAQKITLGFHLAQPATGLQATVSSRYFKMVEEATKGKYTLDVKYYPVGTLFGGADIYEGVVKGVVDAGSSIFSYTPGRFPVMLTLSQAGIAPLASADAGCRTTWEFYNKFKPKELDDVKVLYLINVPPAWLHSRTPIHKLEDIKGIDIRATGASATAIKALGANPIAMPQDEVYLSAQKGIIKASVAPLEVLKTFKQGEVFDYSTFIPFCYSEQFFVIMNWAKWNSLPKDLQKAFDDVAEKAVKEAGQIWQSNEQTAMDWARENGKQEYIYLSDEEAARWKELLKPIRDAYIADLNAKGFPGEEIVSAAGKIAEESNKQKYEPWKP
jgi:TRAP-type C4-dicarboxylate transport system substrate-binding protein